MDAKQIIDAVAEIERLLPARRSVGLLPNSGSAEKVFLGRMQTAAIDAAWEEAAVSVHEVQRAAANAGSAEARQALDAFISWNVSVDDSGDPDCCLNAYLRALPRGKHKAAALTLSGIDPN